MTILLKVYSLISVALTELTTLPGRQKSENKMEKKSRSLDQKHPIISDSESHRHQMWIISSILLQYLHALNSRNSKEQCYVDCWVPAAVGIVPGKQIGNIGRLLRGYHMSYARISDLRPYTLYTFGWLDSDLYKNTCTWRGNTLFKCSALIPNVLVMCESKPIKMCK